APRPPASPPAPRPRRPPSGSQVDSPGLASPSRGRACRPQPPSARPAPLSAPRAAPSRPRGVRTLGGRERRRDRGGKEEERGGRLSAGVGSRRRTPDSRPARAAKRGFCGRPGFSRNARPGAGWRLPLGGSRRGLHGRGTRRPPAVERDRARSRRRRSAGERG
ncbi:unnamed protein product, partial [Rangifer tarandus platyrhynchus]